MRAGFAVAVVLAGMCLAGCDSLFTLTTDAFDPGNTDQSTFFHDGAECGAQAGRALDTMARTEAGEQREVYNRAFAQCMTRLGYQRHDLRPGNYSL